MIFDMLRRQIVPARHFRYHRTRADRLRNDPALLLLTPAPTPFHAGPHLDPAPQRFMTFISVDHI